MSKPYGGELHPIDHGDGILAELGPSTDRDTVIRDVARTIIADRLADQADDEEIRDAAHSIRHRFPAHASEYRAVRRLLDGAHIVLPDDH